MQKVLLEEPASKIASLNGIDIFHVRTGKFKTNTINFFFHDSLRRENAAKNALVPAVLRRGCKRFPTFQDIALYLEELYGATFDCGIAKKGERQIIQFYMEYVADEYTGENYFLFEKAFELLFEIVTDPVLENGGFKSEYVEQEKENVRRLIEARINDKNQYAVDKCLEEMCKDEPYGIYDYGSVEDLAGINAVNLHEHYKSFLESYPMQVYITGNLDPNKMKGLLDKLGSIKRQNIKSIDRVSIQKEVKDVREVTEKMSINQGKLSLGFRTNTSPDSRDYYSLVVYNGILGGGIHSKLFQNVREKASLAYYVFSRLEKFKGLMVISSGIDMQNRDKAVGIILKQIDEIKEGNISSYEFESTMKTIETGIKSLKDSQIQIVDFYLSQTIAGTEDNIDTIVDKIKSVTIEDVVKISRRVKLDMVYFLTGDTAAENL